MKHKIITKTIYDTITVFNTDTVIQSEHHTTAIKNVFPEKGYGEIFAPYFTGIIASIGIYIAWYNLSRQFKQNTKEKFINDFRSSIAVLIDKMTIMHERRYTNLNQPNKSKISELDIEMAEFHAARIKVSLFLNNDITSHQDLFQCIYKREMGIGTDYELLFQSLDDIRVKANAIISELQ